MGKAVGCALAIATIVALVCPVSAKARTVRMTITGQHFRQPIEVTNSKAVINVWTGTREAESWFDFPRPFFGSIAQEPDAALPRYTISFYVDAYTEEPKVREIYAVRYVPDPRSGGGFVYLPGPRDSDRLVNEAIGRRGKDGRWLRASSEWSSAINAHLAAAAVWH